VSRAQQHAALAQHQPSGAAVAAAIGCAAGLPAMLHLLRAAKVGFVLQAISFVAFAAAAPYVVRRFGDRRRAAATPPARVMLAVAVGLALAAAAVSCGRLFFDAGAEIAHCVNRLDNEARLARLVENQELARAVARVRASVPLVLVTAIVFPFAEERIYRGLLQDVLVRKFGSAYGIFAAAVAFGIAHLGVYEVALYQTVLLGLGFGLAYAEGGILAAFFVHATWNLLQIG
jgi:membrane protease YdiL (CAAX protease family)